MRPKIIFSIYGYGDSGLHVNLIDKPVLQQPKGGIIFVLFYNGMVSDMNTREAENKIQNEYNTTST